MATETRQQVILIIEDEASLRKALRDKFAREGFLTLDAKDGESGFSLAVKKEPDLILLDVVMPKLDGMRVLRQLRAQEGWGKTVPVMLLTNLGADDKSVLQAIREDKQASYLVKSNWSISDIVAKVRKILSSQ